MSLPTPSRASSVSLTLLAAAFGLAACGDEAPLNLASGAGGEAGSDGGAGGTTPAADAGGSPSGTDGAHYDDQGRLLRIEIDRAGLAATVLPILDARCAGPICHGGAPTPDARFMLKMPAATQTGDAFEANLTELTDFLDFYAPEQSAILRYGASTAGGQPDHPAPGISLPADSADYAAIVAWLRASVVVVETDAGPGPSPGADGGVASPCGGLPSTASSRYDFGRYQAEIDGLLRESCAGSTCHGTQGAAGGLFLHGGAGDADCETTWNFFAMQWFVDPLRPSASPILLKPLDPAHGGAEVFHGVNDPRHTVLLRYIEDAWTQN